MTATGASAGWGAAPVFTDPQLAGKVVQSLYVTELRQAIDSLRAHNGMGEYPWASAVGRGDTVTAESFLELRRALDQALGEPAGGYTAGLTSKQPIRAVFLEELRRQILDAWQGGSSGVDIRWLVADQLGTPRMVVDRTGSLAGVTRHDYLPFGEEVAGDVTWRIPARGYVGDNVRQKFTKKERDAETDLDFFDARYYSSKMGRFTSPDEFAGGPDELYYFIDDAADNPTFYADLTNPQSLNKYQYAYNNPLRYIDPDGHAGQEPDVIIPQPPVPQCYLCPMKQRQEQLVEWRNAVRVIEEHNKRVREREDNALVPPPPMDPCLAGSSCPAPPEPPSEIPKPQMGRTKRKTPSERPEGEQTPPGQKPHSNRPDKRDRGKDRSLGGVADQQESIQRRQREVRRGKGGAIIDTTEKSKQDRKNETKKIHNSNDANND